MRSAAVDRRRRCRDFVVEGCFVLNPLNSILATLHLNKNVFPEELRVCFADVCSVGRRLSPVHRSFVAAALAVMALRLAPRGTRDSPLSLRMTHCLSGECKLGVASPSEDKLQSVRVEGGTSGGRLRSSRVCSSESPCSSSAPSVGGAFASHAPFCRESLPSFTRCRLWAVFARRFKTDVSALPPWRRWAEPLPILPRGFDEKHSESEDSLPHPAFSALRDVFSVANATFAFRIQRAFRGETASLGVEGTALPFAFPLTPDGSSASCPSAPPLSPTLSAAADFLSLDAQPFPSEAFVALAELPGWSDRARSSGSAVCADRLPSFGVFLAAAAASSPLSSSRESVTKQVVAACVEFLLNVFPSGVLASRMPPQLLMHLEQQLRVQGEQRASAGGGFAEEPLSLLIPHSVFRYLVEQTHCLLSPQAAGLLEPEQALQLLVALGEASGEAPGFEAQQRRPPHVKAHWVAEQQRRLAKTLHQPSHRRLLEKLFERALQASPAEESGLPSTVTKDSLVSLMALYWRRRLRLPQQAELLLGAVASEAVHLSVPDLLELLSLMTRFERLLEKRVRGGKGEGVDWQVCFAVIDRVGERMQREHYLFGEEQVADVCRSLVALKAKYEAAKERSRRAQVKTLLNATSLKVLGEDETSLTLPAFNQVFDLWKTPLGQGLLQQLQERLHEYKYFNLLDAGELLYELAPPDKPLCVHVDAAQSGTVAATPSMDTRGSDRRFLRHPLSAEDGVSTGTHVASTISQPSPDSWAIVKTLQRRVANETWKFVPAMKFGYSGKALKVGCLIPLKEKPCTLKGQTWSPAKASPSK